MGARHQPGAGNPGPGDRDLAAMLYLVKQAGQMRLSFVDINGS